MEEDIVNWQRCIICQKAPVRGVLKNTKNEKGKSDEEHLEKFKNLHNNLHRLWNAGVPLPKVPLPKLSLHKQCLKKQPYGTIVVEWHTQMKEQRDYLNNIKKKTLLHLNQNQKLKNKPQTAHAQIFKTRCASFAKGKPMNIFSMSDN